MKTYIRLDQIGSWKGVEHNSSMNGMGEETYFEGGVSCYELNDDGMAMLYRYWVEVASFDAQDAERYQITIFNGVEVGMGSDYEVIAEVIETVKEIPAKALYEKWMELDDRYYEDEETDAFDVAEYIEQNAQEVLAIIE